MKGFRLGWRGVDPMLLPLGVTAQWDRGIINRHLPQPKGAAPTRGAGLKKKTGVRKLLNSDRFMLSMVPRNRNGKYTNARIN